MEDWTKTQNRVNMISEAKKRNKEAAFHIKVKSKL